MYVIKQKGTVILKYKLKKVIIFNLFFPYGFFFYNICSGSPEEFIQNHGNPRNFATLNTLIQMKIVSTSTRTYIEKKKINNENIMKVIGSNNKTRRGGGRR